MLRRRTAPPNLKEAFPTACDHRQCNDWTVREETPPGSRSSSGRVTSERREKFSPRYREERHVMWMSLIRIVASQIYSAT